MSTTAQHFTDIGDVTLTSDYTRLDNLRDSLTVTIAGLDDFVNTYAYDDLKRLTSVTQSGASPLALVAEKRVDFGWRPDNLPDAVTHYTDLAGTQLVAASSFSYDEQSRLTGITHSQDATILASYDLAFDAASRLTTFTTLADGAVDYDYDDRGQLEEADYVDPGFTDESYTYDGNGNRTNTGFVLDPYNRYTSDGVYTYQYDAEGNRTLRTEIATSATVEYEWDHANRLVQLVDRDSAGAVTQTITYTYDLYDRRIAKTIDDGVTVTVSAR